MYFTYCSSRPPDVGVPPPGKAVLSMGGLSHSVIRVDTEEKLSVLTVQDVGQVMPGGKVRSAAHNCSSVNDVIDIISLKIVLPLRMVKVFSKWLTSVDYMSHANSIKPGT